MWVSLVSDGGGSEARTTIIIPTFNRCNLLTKALNSALNQTVFCHVIVVDHGSTDDTAAVVGDFGDRVMYLRRETDHGPIFAWLEGVLHAQTPFVKLLFDDDYLAPQFLEYSEPLITADVGFAVVQAEIINLENGTVMSTRYRFPDAETGVYSIDSKLGKKIEVSMISPSALILRRRDALSALYLEKLPFQRHSYFGAGPDHYLKLFTMLHYPKFAYVAGVFSAFGSHPQSITVNARESTQQRLELDHSYREVWIFYLVLKTMKRLLPLFRSKESLGSALLRPPKEFIKLLRSRRRSEVRELHFD